MMARSLEQGLRGSAATMARERTAFVVLAFVLTAFGLLMIYSSSSIMALTSEDLGHNPSYYLLRQFAFALAGSAIALVCARVDYHVWSRTLMPVLWLVVVAALVLVLTPVAGQDAYGATRWIAIGRFHMQPSEFAKATVLLAAANLIERQADGEAGDLRGFALRGLVMVGLPLALILLQPDKGTVLIVGLTVVVLLFLAGMPLSLVATFCALGIAGILVLAFRDAYSRARIMTMLDPWIDPYGDGYQLIQGLYAFGSGRLFGVGLGMSRQKYSYLPMAHNDFIFAVIGEELGFVGTVCLLVAFLALVWLGLRIARSAPDLSGRLIAAGAVTTLGIQLLVNICGVLALIPLSGKPIPFISYGGSSIMSTLLLVGLVVSVSRTSQADADRLPLVVHERTQAALRVIEGGPAPSPQDLRAQRGHAAGRVTYNANGTRRIDLGPSASDRLRGRDGARGGRG